jgi:tetratricopeptide (TPR) repeat protein
MPESAQNLGLSRIRTCEKYRGEGARLAAAFLLFLLPVLTLAQTPGVSLTPEPPPLSEARSLLNKGSASDAERLARNYLLNHPNSGDAHFLLGYILFKEIQSEAERNPGALRDEVQAASHGPGDSNFQDAAAKASLREFTEGAKYRTPGAFDLKIVALDYVLLGDYADADKWLTRSVQLDPEDEQAWYYLGRTKYNENRFREAIQAFERCLERDPRSVKVEENLGLAYAGLGEIEEAITAYKTAISWQDQPPEKTQQKTPARSAGPYVDMGDLLLDQNRTEEAVPYLQEAVAISPLSAKAHELLGKAYTRLDLFPLAQGELEKAVNLAPRLASLHCMLGPVYRRQGLSGQAQLEFDQCSKLTASPGSHP